MKCKERESVLCKFNKQLVPVAKGKENKIVRLKTDLGPDPSAGSNELEFGVVVSVR